MKTFELPSSIGSILAVGVALGAAVIGSNANLHAGFRAEMQNMRTEMRSEMQSFRTEVRSDIRSLETRLSAVEQRQANTEGLLEGLRDAIAALERRVPHAEKEPT